MKQQKPQSKHSHIGASGAYRWFMCPGSPRMIAQAPTPEPSSFAIEGTAAHMLAEKCFRLKIDAKSFLGGTITVEEGLPKPVPVQVTQEMVDAVQLYLDTVYADLKAMPGAELFVEYGFNLSHIFEGLYGTNDALLYVPFGTIMRVYDFKYGAGVPVDVIDNKQLLYYAVGALTLEGCEPEDIELVIVQPRAPHKDGPVRRWVTCSKYLSSFTSILQWKAEKTLKPDAELVPGEHCKWCAALPLCPAVVQKVQETAIADFSEKPVPALPAPDLMTRDQLKRVLDLSGLINDWIRAVEMYAEELAKKGDLLDGYKLVKKRSNRKWIDPKEAEAIFTLEVGEAAFEKKLLSPAQMEKLVGKENLILVELNCEQPDAGTCLVPENDPREAVAPSALTDFS